MKNIKVKAIIIACALLGILLINTVKTTQLTDRAFALSIGIDYVKDRYFVSLEIAIPSPNSNEHGSIGIMSDSGYSISEIFDKIKRKTGQVVSVAHCNVVILGKDLVLMDKIPLLINIVKQWRLPENALIVQAENSAIELQRSPSQMGKSTGEEIYQALIGNGESAHFVATRVKNFVVDYRSKNGASFITLVKATKVDEDDSEESNKYIYDYGSSVILSKGKKPLVIEDKTLALALVMDSVTEGKLEFSFNGEVINLNIEKLKRKFNKKVDDFGRVNLDLTLSLSIIESEDFTKLDYSRQEKNELAQKFGKSLQEDILQLFSMSKQANLDVFLLYERLDAFCHKRWHELIDKEDNYLYKILFTNNITINII